MNMHWSRWLYLTLSVLSAVLTYRYRQSPQRSHVPRAARLLAAGGAVGSVVLTSYSRRSEPVPWPRIAARLLTIIFVLLAQRYPKQRRALDTMALAIGAAMSVLERKRKSA